MTTSTDFQYKSGVKASLHFTGILRLEILRPGQSKWHTDGEFSFRFGEYDITVPAGFITDLASVPRILRSVTLASSVTAWAGVVHDYLYWTGEVDRKTADKALYLALIASHVGKFWAFVYWLAVRLFGWIAWNKRRKQHEKTPIFCTDGFDSGRSD